MLNLLPQTEKKRLISEYRLRFGATVAVFACALLIAAIVGLFPSYMSKKSEMRFLTDQKSQADGQSSVATFEEADALAVSNADVLAFLEARVAVLKSTVSTTEIIKKVFEKRTSAISFSSVDLIGKNVNVRGTATTREELIAFHEALKTEPLFRNSTLPISDLARSTKADFAISIMLP